MGKQIIEPTHLKNKILMSVYIFRFLPTYYFEDIQIKKDEKRKAQFIINNLVQEGYLKKQPSQRESIKYLLLTKKGHDFVIKNILKQEVNPFYLYRTDRLAKFNDSDHRFMNFVYIWDWIEKNSHLLNTGIRIYEDSNRNYCKLNFTYGADAIVLFPDVLILLPDVHKGSEFFKAIIVENDTGVETSGVLFRKIVEYSAYAMRGLQQGFISEAELIFTLHSKARSSRVLPNMIKHAQNYNSTLKVKDVKAAHILQAFMQTGMTIQFSIIDTTTNRRESIYESLQFDLRKELLAHNPSWQYLL